MSLVLDLNFVCLICLRKPKKYHSIFDADEQTPDIQIIDKILKCSELNYQIENSRLPDKICDGCLSDLMSAWRFQKNCRKANNMFQYVQDEESEVLATIQLEQDEIKMPLGLKIKQMNRTEEPTTTSTTAIKNHKNISKIDDDSQEQQQEQEQQQQQQYTFIGDDRASPESIYVNLERCTDEEGGTEPTDNDDDDDDIDADIEADELYLTEEMTEEDDEEILDSKTIPIEKPIKDENLNNHEDFLDDVITLPQPTAQIPPKRGRGRPKKHTQSVGSTALVEQNQPIVKKTIMKTEENRGSGLRFTHNMKNGMTKKSSYIRQRRTDIGDTRSPKICEICGNSYKYQHALNAHMRRHNNVRPYGCEFCEKSFVSCVELQRHMRVHTGHKPYACQYCDRRFSDFGSRIKHERTHTGERPYRCTTCNKCFAYAHVLSVHVRTHTGEKRFQCGDCGKGFTKKAYLLSHQGHNGRSTCIPANNQIYDNSTTKTITLSQDNGSLSTEYVLDAAANIKYEQQVDENLIMDESFEQIIVNNCDEDNMAEEHLDDDNDDDNVNIVYEIQTN